jgi:hypothetical protein
LIFSFSLLPPSSKSLKVPTSSWGPNSMNCHNQIVKF